MANLAQYDALVWLLQEAVPNAHQALLTSALVRWQESMPDVAEHAATDALDSTMPSSGRCRAVVSEIPRCALAMSVPDGMFTCLQRSTLTALRHRALQLLLTAQSTGCIQPGSAHASQHHDLAASEYDLHKVAWQACTSPWKSAQEDYLGTAVAAGRSPKLRQRSCCGRTCLWALTQLASCWHCLRSG